MYLPSDSALWYDAYFCILCFIKACSKHSSSVGDDSFKHGHPINILHYEKFYSFVSHNFQAYSY